MAWCYIYIFAGKQDKILLKCQETQSWMPTTMATEAQHQEHDVQRNVNMDGSNIEFQTINSIYLNQEHFLLLE